MPDPFDLYGLFKLPATTHALTPLWIDPAMCNTAEIADAANLGQRIVHTQHHVMHYRSPGPCHLSHIVGAEADGTCYIPVHMPERRDLGNHSIVVAFTGTPDGEAELEWGRGLGSGTPTSYWTGWGDGDGVQTVVAVLDYDAPSGTGAHSVTVIEIKHTNFAPRYISAYHCWQRTIEPDQYLNAPGAASPGRVIDSTSASYAGMIQSVGSGTDEVESLERLTRRVFLNGTHPDGIYIHGNDASEPNIFNKAEFSGRCRDLLGTGGDRYCYPVFVAKANSANAAITVTSSVAGDDWSYTWQAGDGTDPILITPWRVGTSSADGLLVAADGVDRITIKAKVAANTDAYIYAWALFEGPAW